MALAWSMVFVFLLLLLINRADSTCTKFFECGRLGTLEYPLTNRSGCGLFLVDNCSEPTNPFVQFGAGDVQPYYILQKMSTNGLLIYDHTIMEHPTSSVCLALRNLSLPLNPSVSFTVTPNLTMFLCANQYSNQLLPNIFEHYTSSNCPLFQVYYRYPVTNDPVPGNIPEYCSAIQVPINARGNPDNLTDLLTREFLLEWSVSEDCNKCHNGGGSCLTNHLNEFRCGRDSNRRKVAIASLASGGGALLITSFVVGVYILWRRKKRMKEDYLLSRSISFDPSLKSDVEGGSFYYGIPIFSYTELEEATNNFDPSKELGDGGFGTVYHGKLRDGREVAIKRLYEHNCRRVQQFINEIKILTALRHQNLVSLYGCTSRRSRELLLVYEYIPNGTLADHLHGSRASEARLPWPVRMRIAVETAAALAYLHKSDIIHRDVKTNNILLDDSFRVKVADFGLSRLFPDDVTHVSTAPQGTPGYVDPDYHQCYQLTSKSDVYSFGVVLIELISSLPAVDITRHRHEINLANLAVNRIQRCAFEELIDPVLGYMTDAEVARMTTLVAELAYRCLQLDKDLRPSMDEVVDSLRDVEGKGHDGNFGKAETDEAVLLKEKDLQTWPSRVMDVWASSSSTTSSSVS